MAWKVSSVEFGVRSLECGAWSVNCKVWSVKCGVWSEDCGVRSVVECGECGGVWWSVVECGGVWWSVVECRVWSVGCGGGCKVRSVECKV